MQVDASGKPVVLMAVSGLHPCLPDLDVSCSKGGLYLPVLMQAPS